MSHSNEFKKYATKHLNIPAHAVDGYINQVEGMTRNVCVERLHEYREMDIFSRLMRDRIIYLGTKIDSYIANIISGQLLFLESTGPKKPIRLYINTPGGSIYDGLAIYDVMQCITSPVHTVGIGLIASMGSILLVAGEAGQRTALPHARVMIHQPMSGTQGQMEDMEIAVKQVRILGEELYAILAKHSGQPLEKIRKDANRDFWMKAEEAQQYGIIDNVLTSTN